MWYNFFLLLISAGEVLFLVLSVVLLQGKNALLYIIVDFVEHIFENKNVFNRSLL